ncbi:MAG: sugar transferase, partial [Ruminococcaceae bacterium]|nr:sugar transferase [Oscillospiraceae bacterium]
MTEIHKKGLYEKYIKVPQDICIATVALILLSPIIAVTALIVRIKLGSPVIFCQERSGRGGKAFRMYKFRSMSDEVDADGNLLPDEVRLGHFGKILRSTSLDELPSLWNVVCGNVSLVGPRALYMKYNSLY